MATKKMMQGDSYNIPFTLTMNGTTEIAPDMIADLELCVGDDNGVAIRKTYDSGTVFFDDVERKWFFRPSQEETLAMEPGSYDVIVRMKFSDDPNADVVGIRIGRISIGDTQSEEVL